MGVLGDAMRIVACAFMSGSFFDHVKGIRQQFEYMPWEKRKAILEGWVELLTRYEWDVFATFTWRNATSAEVIIKNFRWWLWTWQLETAIPRGMAWIENGKARGPWASASRCRSMMNSFHPIVPSCYRPNKANPIRFPTESQSAVSAGTPSFPSLVARAEHSTGVVRQDLPNATVKLRLTGTEVRRFTSAEVYLAWIEWGVLLG